jgi:hypothetical protein
MHGHHKSVLADPGVSTHQVALVWWDGNVSITVTDTALTRRLFDGTLLVRVPESHEALVVGLTQASGPMWVAAVIKGAEPPLTTQRLLTDLAASQHALIVTVAVALCLRVQLTIRGQACRPLPRNRAGRSHLSRSKETAVVHLAHVLRVHELLAVFDAADLSHDLNVRAAWDRILWRVVRA